MRMPRSQSMLALMLLTAVALGRPALGQEAQATPPEFQAADSGQPVQEVEVSAAENPRYWKVIKALAEALNNEDRAAFMALFSPRLIAKHAAAKDPLEDAVSWMNQAMAERGNIARFHQMSSRGLKAPGSALPERTAVFLFEDGMTGYFGVALDEHDKIDGFSYFILADFCANDNPRCQGPAMSLAELPVGQ